jgi:hypothetical protein
VVDQVPVPQQVGLAPHELDQDIIPAAIIADHMQRLVEIGDEVHNPAERVFAAGAALGRGRENSGGSLDGRDHTPAAAIVPGVVLRRAPGDAT